MVDYKPLRILIIEDMPNFSSALRNMLMFYGAEHQNIQVAASGEDALPLLNGTRYDVVLSDYNLGEGRNGNDVLEEAKHNNLLKSSCVYIMLTAENSVDMVMGALEYSPDEYLTKPFTKEVMNARLERLLIRRNALMSIYKQIDKKQLESAISQCNSLVSEHPRYKGYLLKLKTDLMMQTEAYEPLLDIYSALLKVKFIPWAQLGLGKCHYYLGDYPKAEAAFRAILEQNKRYVQAWDWLARVLEKQGDTQGGQQALREATDISPRNVRRQSQLGELATRNGDLEVAEKAFNQSVKVGKNSVHRSPDNYLGLAKVLAERVKTVDPRVAKRMGVKATAMMDELRSMYRKDPKVALQSRLAEGDVHVALGNENAANQALAQAFDLCSKDEEGELPAALKERVVKQLEASDQQAKASALVSNMEQGETARNAQAIELYGQGELAKALTLLGRAVRDNPDSFAINLNFAQVALHHMSEQSMDETLMKQVAGCFGRVKSLPASDERYKLLQQLKARFQKLQQV